MKSKAKSYSEKLRDPRWQRKRLEVMQRDGFKCRSCSREDRTLNIHHCYYLPGKSPWEYPKDHLVTLCENCHDDMTQQLPRLLCKIRTPDEAAWASQLMRSNTPKSGGVLGDVAYALRAMEEIESLDFCTFDIDRVKELVEFSIKAMQQRLDAVLKSVEAGIGDEAPEFTDDELTKFFDSLKAILK